MRLVTLYKIVEEQVAIRDGSFVIERMKLPGLSYEYPLHFDNHTTFKIETEQIRVKHMRNSDKGDFFVAVDPEVEEILEYLYKEERIKELEWMLKVSNRSLMNAIEHQNKRRNLPVLKRIWLAIKKDL